MGRNLGFETPARKSMGKEGFECNPRKVDEWIAELPSANAGETARRVFFALGKTNRQIIKHRHRVHLLEQLREPVRFATEQMQKRFVGGTFPLPEKNRQIAAATRELSASMATGYKIAIEDLVTSSFLMVDNRSLCMLLHRAVTYLSRVLLTSYQAYTEFPAQTWLELHRLYGFAEKRKLHRIPIADEQHQYLTKTTIENEYTRSLLLFLTSPYHLRHGEVGKIYVNLERWFSVVKLQNYTGAEADGFVINLNADDPPRWVTLVNAPEHEKDCRVLSTIPLIDTLKKELSRKEDSISSTLIGVGLEDAALPHDLINKLLLAWHAGSKRRFNRTNKSEDVKVAIGMSSIHCGLLTQSSQESSSGKMYEMQRHSLEQMFSSSSRFEGHDVKDVNAKGVDVWDMVYNRDVPDKDAGDETEEVLDVLGQGAVQHSLKSCPVDDWTILNESAGGVFVRCRQDCSSRVQVGELVALRRVINGQQNWSLGLVRWMMTYGNEGVETGILFLAPDAIPVGITLSVDEPSPENFQRALLVPGSVASNHQTTLITPPYPYRVGAIVSVYFMGSETRVRLTRQIGNTGLCAQFHFDIVAKPKVEESSTDQDDEFEDVWTLI